MRKIKNNCLAFGELTMLPQLAILGGRGLYMGTVKGNMVILLLRDYYAGLDIFY